MDLRTTFRVWTFSGSISSLTFFVELINSYLNVNPLYRIIFLVILGLIILISFIKSVRSYKHIISMQSIGRAIRKKAVENNHNYELKIFNNFESLSRALHLDRDTYDEEHTWTIHRWSEFFVKNRFIAFGLFHSNDFEQQNCLGGISCFPISNETFISLKMCQINEMDLTADDLLNEKEMQNAKKWLIPGLVIFDARAGSVKSSIILSKFLTSFVDKANFPLSLIAFGYSHQGKTILKKFGFSKINKGDHNSLSIFTNTVSSREEFFLKIPPLLKRM